MTLLLMLTILLLSSCYTIAALMLANVGQRCQRWSARIFWRRCSAVGNMQNTPNFVGINYGPCPRAARRPA